MTTPNSPRAYTQDETTALVLERVRQMAAEWANMPDKTPKERCDGLAFSIMAMLDGETAGMPGMSVAMQPHPDDKAFRIEQGENWFEPGTTLRNWLHELYYAA